MEIDLRDDIDIYIDDNYVEPPEYCGDPYLRDHYYTKKEIKEDSERCVNELLSGKAVNFSDRYKNTYIIMNIVQMECDRLHLPITIEPGMYGYYLERIIE